tara:strand:+ start:5504 stop:5983 length:480 start_codon:yes stop_codon:yes gene_type:complete
VKSYNHPKVIKKYAEKNYKLVPYFAKSYTKTLTYYQREELIQEGYIGLLYASRSYNESLGFKFSTYSSYWIKRYFVNYLEKIKKHDYHPLKLDVIKYYDYKKEIDLEVLDEVEKDLIKKRYYEKKKIKEIAEEYNYSRNTISNKLKASIYKLYKVNNKV